MKNNNMKQNQISKKSTNQSFNQLDFTQLNILHLKMASVFSKTNHSINEMQYQQSILQTNIKYKTNFKNGDPIYTFRHEYIPFDESIPMDIDIGSIHISISYIPFAYEVTLPYLDLISIEIIKAHTLSPYLAHVYNVMKNGLTRPFENGLETQYKEKFLIAEKYLKDSLSQVNNSLAQTHD